MGDVSIPWFVKLHLPTHSLTRGTHTPYKLFQLSESPFLCARLEVDVSTLTVNEKQLYSYMLNPGKGRVVFLITLRSVWGVSISDIENATLSKPDEKDEVVAKFVRFSFCTCIMLKRKTGQ